MFKRGKEMFTQSVLKNKCYIFSKRNFNDDYSNIPERKINMMLSGKCLCNFPKMLDEIKFDEYPTHNQISSLQNIIKKKLNTSLEITLGSGANGIIQNLVKLTFIKGGNLVTPFYTFNQVEYAVSAMNCFTKRVLMDDNHIDFQKLLKSVDKNTRMIYISNPNTPTGDFVDSDVLLSYINKISKKILIVIDESGIEFTNKKSLIEYSLPNNVIILRSFSKAYGLSGLRIGYMLSSKKFANKYKENIAGYDVSIFSCKMAEFLIEKNLYKENVKLILKEREWLKNELQKLNIHTYTSYSNILFTKNTFNDIFLKALYDSEISVVPVYDETNRMHVRIAIQDSVTNKKFIATLKNLITGGKIL